MTYIVTVCQEESDELDEFTATDVLVILKNGMVIKKRNNPKVVRYVWFNKCTHSENHFKEKLLLFLTLAQ